MNIKQAEVASGIQKRNIRFYEKEGLISPKRNESNDYRDYSEEDIQTLKMVRMLRMIDMPLEQIKDIIQGKITMEEATAKQKLLLKEREKELAVAIQFCDELEKCAKKNSLNVESILEKMDQPENQKGLFKQWIEDYKKVSKLESWKTFIFYPDIAIKTPADFTLALCKYADEQNLNLVITKEGMYPHFTIDGIEYEAERYYRTVHNVPVNTVRCKMVNSEEYDVDLPKGKKRAMKMIHDIWIPLLFLAMCVYNLVGFSLEELFHTWEGIVILLAAIVMAGVSVYFYVIFYYNERH